MKELLQEITNDLVSDKASLESILLKAKVIAFKIDNPTFKEWVNNELNGYDQKTSLPDYRKQPGQVMGTMSNGFERISNMAIPIAHLNDKMVDMLTNVKFHQSLSSIEHSIAENESGTLTANLTPEHCALINLKIPTSNGFKVEFAHVLIPVGGLKEIVSTVKSKLLEFILELEKQFELSLDFKTMKKEEKKVDQMVHNIIYGDNNVVISGSKNEAEVTYNISKNNIDELVGFLKQAGIQNEDLDELKQILPTEEYDHKNKSYGQKTKSWLAKMTSKAIEGTWSVGLNAAGQILGTALEKYYGI